MKNCNYPMQRTINGSLNSMLQSGAPPLIMSIQCWPKGCLQPSIDMSNNQHSRKIYDVTTVVSTFECTSRPTQTSFAGMSTAISYSTDGFSIPPPPSPVRSDYACDAKAAGKRDLSKRYIAPRGLDDFNCDSDQFLMCLEEQLHGTCMTFNISGYCGVSKGS